MTAPARSCDAPVASVERLVGTETNKQKPATSESPRETPVRDKSVAYLLAASVLILWPVGVRAEGPAKSATVKSAAVKSAAVKSAAVETTDGKSLDKDGNPTYRIATDGTVDWYTYSGFRRYHSECHVCHGPNGDGSSFAPALKESLKRITYSEFLGVVASGRKNVTTAQENVMPAFGSNPNVMCYIDDIYIYLHARSDDAIGPARPGKHDDKPAAFAKAEEGCMGK
jgi:methanol metabolism-related c-type cytochrome